MHMWLTPTHICPPLFFFLPEYISFACMLQLSVGLSFAGSRRALCPSRSFPQPGSVHLWKVVVDPCAYHPTASYDLQPGAHALRSIR